jgi:hypothetical protein
VRHPIAAVADPGQRGEDGPVADRRRLTEGDVAAWLIKTSRPLDELADGWEPGGTRVLERCLRPSYRLALMRPGQPCLLWLSGRDEPGVHAVGTLTTWPTPGAPEPSVTASLRRLERPVARADLRGSFAFADAEVLRVPAGSNPSYLTAAQLAAVHVLGADAGRRVAAS